MLHQHRAVCQQGGLSFSSVTARYGYRHCVRAAKEMDSKPIGHCPQGIESSRCRFDHLRIVVDTSLEVHSALCGRVFFFLTSDIAEYLWDVLIQYLDVGGGGRICAGGYVDGWANGDGGGTIGEDNTPSLRPRSWLVCGGC